MPGQRARRHFSQLSEFGRGLIIGLKTAGCSTRRVAGQCPFRALPLTPEHGQLRIQWCQARSMWNVTDWQKVVFSDESRFVLETDDDRVRVWRRPDSSMAARSPDLSPVEHVWDQLKRQMPSCHSVHDLELAVYDLWAHLPQDNIMCLINSMLDRVAACIAAGGGPTRY
ncbi:uncharacterized protein TNCV_1919771 [Trichonephila clavipes]|nr:uncharacterized protein TNCV_1919771 [Trichonephila clavipes]